MLSCCGYGISIGGTGTETNVTGCYNCIGYNNVIVSEVPGEMLRGLVLFNSENSGYYNNIVIGAREGFYTRKFTNYPPNINPSFKNNIVINSTAVAHNLLANSNTGTIDFDYNLYYNNPTQPTEPNSIYADPQFVNPTSDWHLKSTSPAIDAGIAYTFLDNNGGNIDVTHDKDGNVRSIPWDMGVYEFYTCAVLSVSTVVTNESGSNANDGTISLTANGGSPPYLYVWSNGGNTPVVSNLSGGTYSVTITDAIGCQTVESATVGTVTPNTCASGTTYYVAPNGSDNNPGTLAQPFATMWKVGQVVQAGDVAIFEDGNYIEPHRVDFKTNSGTKDCPIIVKARNQHQAKIVFTTASQGAQSIWIVRPWITIEGFDLSKEVKGTSTSNQIIRIYADTTYSNGVVTDIRRGNYCTVRGNRIHNAYEEGVKSYKSKGLLVEDNIIFDFIHEGIDFVAVDSSIIRGNEVYNVTRMGILAGKGGSRSIQVYNNYVHINNVMPVSGYGISIGGTSTLPIGPAAPTKQLGVACYNCIVYNNLVVSETPGLIQEGLAAFGTRDCGFFNNVVIGADNAFYSRHFHAYTGDTISPVNRNDNLSIKNNIIINSQTSTYDFWAGSLGGIVDFDYNLFFNNPNQPTEPNSVYADPQFVDPASDWHLQGTSPAIEAGIGYTFTGYYGEDIEVTKDWDGSIRTVPWDMGIYEFSGGPPTYIQPDICLWMEGPYDQNTGKMRTTLKQKNILPDNGQPYSVSPWNQTGNNGSGWSTLYPSTMVDWVKVGFRSDVSAASTVVSTTAWLMEDGCLVFLEEELLESYVGNTYYIIVEHRNHLAVMTPTAITLNGDVLSYDFRNGNSYTGGGVGAGQKEILQGVWGMFSGDGEQLLDITGYDINGADQSSWEPQNGLFNMYLSGDYDLNGDVNAGDKVLWNSNNGVFSLIER